MSESPRGHAFKTVVIAVAILAGLSLLDWADITGGKITNFNLFEDIVASDTSDTDDTSNIDLDPNLQDAIDEISSQSSESPESVQTASHALALVASDNDSVPQVDQSMTPVMPVSANIGRIDGIQPIEDYSLTGDAIGRLRRALQIRDSRRCRIAVIGDSYIEGDIFTQDIRRLLQEEFGGNGVGYMCMHSEFPGFRRSVNQSDNGWTAYDIRNRSKDPLRPLSGEYCVAADGAVSTFKSSKSNPGKWHVNRLLYIAPNGGSVTVKTDEAKETYQLQSGDSICQLVVTGETASASFSFHGNGIKALGVWLEDDCGVGVDCMSLRGNSGITHSTLSHEVTAQMNAFVPYDLIVVEYGLNALTASQKDYTNYGQIMSKVIRRIKECFPNTDILMLGVGDRGWKRGSSVSSMPTIEAMISAQRKCAMENGIMFWDTRNAMGGEDAIVDWRKRGLVNADYIHMNHQGGAELAREFVNSLKMKVNEAY